jgi:putative phosphoesterase
VRLAITSDTHIPGRGRDLPAPLWQAIDEADVVIHAGDWVSESIVDSVAARARRLVGVHGNNDGPGLRARLPEIAHETLAGVRVAVVHETGQAQGREVRCARRFPETDLLVFGHSHIPWDTRATTGLRLVNPGSPTDRRRQPYATFVTATLAAGEVVELVFHQLRPDGTVLVRPSG